MSRCKSDRCLRELNVVDNSTEDYTTTSTGFIVNGSGTGAPGETIVAFACKYPILGKPGIIESSLKYMSAVKY